MSERYGPSPTDPSEACEDEGCDLVEPEPEAPPAARHDDRAKDVRGTVCARAERINGVLGLEAAEDHTVLAIVRNANYELQIDGEGPLRTQLDVIEAELGSWAADGGA